MMPWTVVRAARRDQASWPVVILAVLSQPPVWWLFTAFWLLVGIDNNRHESFLHMERSGACFLLAAVCGAVAFFLLKTVPRQQPAPQQLPARPSYELAQPGWTAQIINDTFTDTVKVTVLERDADAAVVRLPDGAQKPVALSALLNAQPPTAPPPKVWPYTPGAPVLVTDKPLTTQQAVTLRSAFHEHHVTDGVCEHCGEVIPDIDVRACKPARMAIEAVHNNVAVTVSVPPALPSRRTYTLIVARPLTADRTVYDYAQITNLSVPAAPPGTIGIAFLSIPPGATMIFDSMIWPVHA
jgi:hypothetical protein